MSIRIYYLLRNNKEQGPFTKEELVQKNLQPYDLIWINGRSAAWSYPGELSEFKIYTPLPGEFNLIEQGKKQQQTITAISPSVQAAIVVNNSITQPAIKQKPRYKVSAAWNKIQTITTLQRNEIIIDAEKENPYKENSGIKKQDSRSSNALSWKQAWLDWEKEKTTIPANTKFLDIKSSLTQTKTANKNYVAPVLETKYTEPLDSLKDKYIENILQQKKASKKYALPGNASHFIIPTLALLIIFSISYWLLHDDSNTTVNISSIKKESSPVSNIQQDVKPGNNNSIANTSNEEQNVSEAKEIMNDQAEERTPVIATKFAHAESNKNSAAPNVLPALKNAEQKTNIQPSKQADLKSQNNISQKAYNDSLLVAKGDAGINNTRSVHSGMNDNATTKTMQKEETTSSYKPHIKSSASYINVPEYIEMNNGSANLKIENISDINLDLVVVDVQYYDASNRFRKGETLYLHNLKAGKNVIIKTPKDTNSLYATSKVSLISSDAKQVYVVGDN